MEAAIRSVKNFTFKEVKKYTQGKKIDLGNISLVVVGKIHLFNNRDDAESVDQMSKLVNNLASEKMLTNQKVLILK